PSRDDDGPAPLLGRAGGVRLSRMGALAGGSAPLSSHPPVRGRRPRVPRPARLRARHLRGAGASAVQLRRPGALRSPRPPPRGAAVVLCDAAGAGPMVTTAALDRVRALNFGVRTLREPLAPEVIAREIARYDAADAARVSRRIRAEAGREAAVDEIVGIYGEVLAEHARRPEDTEDTRTASLYLQWLGPFLKKQVTQAERTA